MSFDFKTFEKLLARFNAEDVEVSDDTETGLRMLCFGRICICSARKLVQLSRLPSLQHSPRPWVLAASVIVVASNAVAFDPTSIVSGVGAVAGIFGGGTDEAIDVGFALSDLMGELEVEKTSTDDVDKAVKDLEELNTKAQDLKYSKDEIRTAINQDLSKAKSLSAKLRAITNMYAASKRIAEIMGLRPRAGMVASQVQQMKINEMILDELQTMRRQQFLSYLDNRQYQMRRSYLLDKVQEEERPGTARAQSQRLGTEGSHASQNALSFESEKGGLQ